MIGKINKSRNLIFINYKITDKILHMQSYS